MNGEKAGDSSRGAVLVAVAAGLAIRFALASTQGEVADTLKYHRVAVILRSGGQLYVDTAGLFPYPPVWNRVEVASLMLAEKTGVPFVVWVKLPSILADAGIALFLAALAPIGRRALYASAYALNPVPILVSGAHGQFDSLPLLCCITAVYVLQRRQSATLAALALTLGIALKSFPVLLVPVFLLDIEGWRRRFLFLAAALIPVGLLLLPNLATAPQAVARELFAYSGAGDHGWMAIARIVHVLRTGTLLAAGKLSGLLSAAKLLFLAAYAVALFVWARRGGRLPPLTLRIAFVFMLFGAVYGGISSQTLIWALPFLLLVSLRDGLLYSAAATWSLVAFYTLFYPTVLYLDPAVRRERLLARILSWLCGTAIWWLFSVWWTGRQAVRLRTVPSGADLQP
ncbi:MAG TPA: hypothetical protein VGQ75_06600 [Thermoanaerobaculia bacterium]|nr:hypothetical protein [Thermoanaerobaculia bacterium]